MRRMAVVIAVAVLAGCAPKVPPETVKHFQSRTLYTCCNMYHQGSTFTDANYRQGEMIPIGTKVKIDKVSWRTITFEANGARVTLDHLYGRAQESNRKYFDKIFVEKNRGELLTKFPKIIARTIRQGRVERGMKRGEVVLALGFPPTDDNPSPEAKEWTYWYDKGQSYKVVFDSNGYVADILGRPAPTNDRPVRVYSGAD